MEYSEGMKSLLDDVYDYNSFFVDSDDEEELLDRIMDAMSAVDRMFFVPADLKHEAYTDAALPVEAGQTISQPSTVARMLFLLEPNPGENILEVGAGSGWNAALLGHLANPRGKIVSVERIPELVGRAKENIKKFKSFMDAEFLEYKDFFSNINFRNENVFEMIFDAKKFDKIIFTAGFIDEIMLEKVENFGKKFLQENGILIVPSASGPIYKYIFEKGDLKKWESEEEYAFVSLADN